MHTAIVAAIEAVQPIIVQSTGKEADSIHLATVLGEKVVVSKEHGIGFVGVLFPADLQLSEEYAKQNNLFRDSEKNIDKTKKGFFEDSRRVRAQPFLGVKSTAYFAGLDSLGFTGVSHFVVGDRFTELGGFKICERYYSKQAREQIAQAKKSGKLRKEDQFPDFSKHVDSDQFKHHVSDIPEGALISIHAKVHGTSFRCGYLPKVVSLPTWKKLVNKLVRVFKETEKSYVVGTRNVILDTPEKEGFHGSEAFRFEVLEALKPHMEYGMTIYGEIAGFANGTPIMPNHDVKSLKDKRMTEKYGNTVQYSYGCKEHEYRFHVYRITRLTVSGEVVEMPQLELDAWCKARGILGPLEVTDKFIYSGNDDYLKALVEELTERPDHLTEDYINPAQISEGVIVRVEHAGKTKFYKNKSYAFKALEGICEVVDMETVS